LNFRLQPTELISCGSCDFTSSKAAQTTQDYHVLFGHRHQQQYQVHDVQVYNVWSCEHVAVYRRIRAICEIIERHDPDVIFLQVIGRPRTGEVTSYIYCLFQEAPWWGNYDEFSSKEKGYHGYTLSSKSTFCLLLSKLHAAKVPGSSPPYTPSSPMYCPSSPPRPCEPRAPSDLLSAWEYRYWWHHGLRAATCILTCPTPSDTGSVHRRARGSAFLEYFVSVHLFDVAVHHREHGTGTAVLDQNVVLGGDLGWDDDLDGPLRLGDGWVDAWLELCAGGGGGGGWTYDAVANPMVRGLKNMAKERRRSDRFVCKLKDFELDSIQMLGVEPIPGVTRFDDDDGNVVPVLPSHHFGLLLTISPKHD
ncbi:hypothetical protein U9M48_015333, partial [Paspalum notatum var. saurae]